MLTIRCKMVVKAAMEELGIRYTNVELGEVEMKEPLSDNNYTQLKKVLGKTGLELLDNKRAVLVEKIKNVIIEMVHYADELPNEKISVYISKKLDYDYTYLSNTFTKVAGISITQFIILHKIEKAKELMLYDELSLSQIAYVLHYSSNAHLTNQFKKITGYTPSQFKTLKDKRRKALDDI
jgi:AraC-like DNA-binding protein